MRETGGGYYPIRRPDRQDLGRVGNYTGGINQKFAHQVDPSPTEVAQEVRAGKHRPNPGESYEDFLRRTEGQTTETTGPFWETSATEPRTRIIEIPHTPRETRTNSSYFTELLGEEGQADPSRGIQALQESVHEEPTAVWERNRDDASRG
jgi:hypothetical protein